ncbi:class I SAM-dependent methyltransferase [Spirosoma taeanense]|uniref:Class I SAM-dependent methyltransferase n=1 Tax=Spirosoma taeanense TaxID=2735870 RepID=A0A6M5YDJ5_9BACT|nr:class I SAM-dependent methyltransferase [Spirosoma taeanense]QJW92059.1 class I SAM-dependent methyltransferase [Spirosoma taeanense]
MEAITHCPVCNHTQFSPYLVCKDYLVSNQEFSIQQCLNCSFRFTNPRPNADEIGSYYKSDQYVSHNDSSSGPVNTVYRLVRNYTLRTKLKLINTLHTGTGRLLDVGCGTGAFLEICQKGGWQVAGMEPDPDARTIAATKLNVDIKPTLKSIGLEKPFDIITLWHVLEHIADIDLALQTLHALLSEKGSLLIAVPNSDSYDAQYFKQYWAAYDVPRHLHHFTPKTIEPLFKKYGFSLVGQRPMVFDAYYISMLSTRYQTGKTDYIKSFQIGLKSNMEASRTGNSSSITYLFKK